MKKALPEQLRQLLKRARSRKDFRKAFYIICNSFMRGYELEGGAEKFFIFPTERFRKFLKDSHINENTFGYILKTLLQLEFIEKVSLEISEESLIGKTHYRRHKPCYRTLPSRVWKGRGGGEIYHHRFYDFKELGLFLNEIMFEEGEHSFENRPLKILLSYYPRKLKGKIEEITLLQHQEIVRTCKECYKNQGKSFFKEFIHLFAHQNPYKELYRTLIHIITVTTMKQLETKTVEEVRKFWDTYGEEFLNF